MGDRRALRGGGTGPVGVVGVRLVASIRAAEKEETDPLPSELGVRGTVVILSISTGDTALSSEVLSRGRTTGGGIASGGAGRRFPADTAFSGTIGSLPVMMVAALAVELVLRIGRWVAGTGGRGRGEIGERADGEDALDSSIRWGEGGTHSLVVGPEIQGTLPDLLIGDGRFSGGE